MKASMYRALHSPWSRIQPMLETVIDHQSLAHTRLEPVLGTLSWELHELGLLGHLSVSFYSLST